MKILNTWQSTEAEKKYFEVGKPLFELGEYRIFKQFNKCYLHTYKNIAINQLCAPNKEHIKNLFNNTRPLTNTKYTPKTFVFDRAKEALKKGVELIKNS